MSMTIITCAKPDRERHIRNTLKAIKTNKTDRRNTRIVMREAMA